jgi:hypothetical protein
MILEDTSLSYKDYAALIITCQKDMRLNGQWKELLVCSSCYELGMKDQCSRNSSMNRWPHNILAYVFWCNRILGKWQKYQEFSLWGVEVSMGGNSTFLREIEWQGARCEWALPIAFETNWDDWLYKVCHWGSIQLVLCQPLVDNGLSSDDLQPTFHLGL